VVVAGAFYATFLLGYGLWPNIRHEEWARLALKFVPLLLVASGLAALLLQEEDRHYQAPPWIYFSGALLLATGFAIALHGLEEWAPDLKPEFRKPLSFLALSLVGAIQATLGLVARRLLRHHCRLATLGVILAGLVAVLTGFGVAGWSDIWPSGWWTVEIFGKPVSFPHVVMPAAALAITLLACRYQLLAFLMVGLVGLAFSIHVLGYLYFEKVPTWPKLMMVLGATCFFVALYRELRRTRGNSIDDVVSQARL
jgi:hypothetical protein